jgi:formiminoglutamate deiminase
MSAIHAGQVLTSGGWLADARLQIEAGRITSITAGAVAEAGDERADVLLPAMPNLHSHAFQRAMAGLAERRGPGTDTFWSWREAMYGVALAVTPDEAEAIAAQLYVEMLEAGFGRVGEFHYLHHDRDGTCYARVAEMGERVAAAAADTGIRLTLLPVFYAHAGFGRQPPAPQQRRFVSSLDVFARLLEGCREAVSGLDGAVVGIAPHSLRAVTADELAALLPLAGDGPVHLHAAEQTREVEDCLAATGRRPVEWLLEHVPIGPSWCLIHATHMTSAEAQALAASGAVAGLCPVTEANLGDGIFAAPAFLAAGGRFGIGSDSNVLIGVADELRQLEYAQRLGTRTRNVVARPGGSTGRALYDAALAGGTQALGAPARAIAVGAPADLVSVDLDRSLLEGRKGDAVLDGWIFATNRPAVDGVWIGGRRLVSGGRHHGRDRIEARFRRAMAAIASRLGGTA